MLFRSVYLTLSPDAGRANRLEEQARVELQRRKAAMSPEELTAILEGGQKLLDYQNREDTEEALATIPVLQIEDIKREIEPVINERVESDIPFVFHETDTRGIGYVDLFFDVSTLTQSELPAAAILIKALGMMDTDKHSYQEFAHEVNRTIGGLMTQLDARADIPHADKGIILPAAEVRMKCC